LKTAFCGTTGFAATVLASLLEGDHAPSLVIAPPPSRAGRGRSLTPSPVAAFASDAGLSVIETDDVNDGTVSAALDDFAPEAVVVCAFGQLIGPALVSSYRFLNVHPSLVPRWRGAAPIERALLAGDSETGVSVMDLTEGLDDGPVLGLERLEIMPRDTYESLAERLASAACSVVPLVLAQIAAGESQSEAQDDSLATYAEKVDPAERHLSPDLSAVDLDRRVRALGGRLGTYLALGQSPDQRLGVVACTPLAIAPEGVTAGRPGEVVSDDGQLFLFCGEGLLALDQVKPPGGKPMSGSDYLRGYDAPAKAL